MGTDICLPETRAAEGQLKLIQKGKFTALDDKHRIQHNPLTVLSIKSVFCDICDMFHWCCPSLSMDKASMMTKGQTWSLLSTKISSMLWIHSSHRWLPLMSASQIL